MEDEMAGWHHWLNGCEFEEIPGDGERRGSLVWCSPWDHEELDTIKQLNWTELNWTDVTLNKSREIIRRKQKVENTNIQIQWIILLKTKRLFHENQNWPKHNWPAGEPPRLSNIGDSPYDVMVHRLFKHSAFSGHGLHCKPELWISSQSCGFPPCLKIALISDFYFLPHSLQTLQNVTSSPSILVTSSIPWILSFFPFERDPRHHAPLNVIGLSHFPTWRRELGSSWWFSSCPGEWTRALALWSGRTGLFSPRDRDRNVMAWRTWPADDMFDWILQSSLDSPASCTQPAPSGPQKLEPEILWDVQS